MSTITLNMHEAKTHLSARIAALQPGDKIILCRRNKPVAEIRPLVETSSEPRPVGVGRGEARIPESFFAPLPEEVLADFENPA